MLFCPQPEVLKRATVETFAVRVRDELSRRDALVERGIAAIRDGSIKPRRSLRVRVEEARHRYPGRVPALVRQDPVLHAPEPAVADKLHKSWGQGRRNHSQRRVTLQVTISSEMEIQTVWCGDRVDA